MVPTSMEQLFTERPLYRCFLHNDHFYTLFPVTSARKFLCNVIGFTIFHLSAGVLLEKVFLGILQNSQENTCSKVSFLIKFQTEVTASDHSCLLLKISCLFHVNRKMKWKKGNTLIELKYLPFCSIIDLLDFKDFKRKLTDGNLIRKCV